MVLPHPPQIRLRHKIGTRTLNPFRQFFEAAAAVEFADGGDDGVALGFCAGVLDGFPERFLWNINCCFHASKVL